MTNLLIFSLITALVGTLFIVPLTKRAPSSTEGKEQEEIELSNSWTNAVNNYRVPLLITTFILLFIIVFSTYYVTNLDRNISSLTIFALSTLLLGALISSGKEAGAKGFLFLLALGFGIYLWSAPLFNATDKYESVAMDEKVEIEAFDETKKPASVPPKFARNKMKKAFGQVPNTSYYELGTLQIQKVGDDYVYVAPVEFSGFFKWFKGKSVPGYFMMSATDSAANPKFHAFEMEYTPSSYLHKEVTRHMRMKYPELIFYGKPQLEVTDEGKPYYIRSYGSFISARDGFDAKGIIMLDPANGNVEKFAMKDIPSFINGAVAPEAVSLQNSYYGKYIHGFWNTVFGKKDVKLPSDEGTEANVSPVFDETGHMYYFTDFTSPKEGVDSMLGYSLTDARTGKGTYYTGNLEESYMDSQGALQIIEKKFIEKKWSGQMPVLYNFYGEASWLTPVMDSNGFLQNYFIVSAANPEISVYADSPSAALKLYKTALQRGGSTVDQSSKAEEKETTITVQRVHMETMNDQTLVSILATNGQNFLVSTEVDPLSIYIERGDILQVTYADTGELFLPIKAMNNTSLNEQPTE